jgi:hypothetical protein
LEVFFKSVNLEVIRTLCGKREKNSTGDVLLESANIAEGFIQGSKEMGKSFLRNVSNKTVRVLHF